MKTTTTPHVRDNYSPLKGLSFSALRRFGDFSPDSIQGDVESMFIEFANLIVDDWNFHPMLAEEDDVPMYTAATEAREIPDQVMLNGLLAHYALQQASDKTGAFQGMYFQALNREAYRITTGGRNPPIEMKVVDR